MVEIVRAPTAEQSTKAKGSSVAIPELSTQEPTKGEPIFRSLRRERKKQHHVRQVTLPLRDRAPDAPIGTFERDVISGSAPS
jgi:hypothetical protein